jgi:hypothetical protein
MVELRSGEFKFKESYYRDGKMPTPLTTTRCHAYETAYNLNTSIYNNTFPCLQKIKFKHF